VTESAAAGHRPVLETLWNVLVVAACAGTAGAVAATAAAPTAAATAIFLFMFMFMFTGISSRAETALKRLAAGHPLVP
jgi:hypothetical protein